MAKSKNTKKIFFRRVDVAKVLGLGNHKLISLGEDWELFTPAFQNECILGVTKHFYWRQVILMLQAIQDPRGVEALREYNETWKSMRDGLPTMIMNDAQEHLGLRLTDMTPFIESVNKAS